MDIDLVFKIAATGIIVAVLNQLLIRSGREDQAMMTTLAGELHASLTALGHSDRAAACAELRRMADLCRREADRQADHAARAMALWPRLGGCAGLLLAILLW